MFVLTYTGTVVLQNSYYWCLQ